ncbi:MAG: hypothetical protein ABIJ56_12205 [Pseudomonadota bacterium]
MRTAAPFLDDRRAGKLTRVHENRIHLLDLKLIFRPDYGLALILLYREAEKQGGQNIHDRKRRSPFN